MPQSERLNIAAKAVTNAAGRCAEAGLHCKADALRKLADRIFKGADRALAKEANYVGKLFTVTGREDQ